MAAWDPAFLQAMSAEHRVLVIDYPGPVLVGVPFWLGGRPKLS
jgi:hypothetical protein